MRIEILPGVFYDSDLPWYEQDTRLIELADTVMQSAPIDSQTETSGQNSRLLWGIWNHTTVMGNFDMRVDFHYLYSIEKGAFLSKSAHDTVNITQK